MRVPKSLKIALAFGFLGFIIYLFDTKFYIPRDYDDFQSSNLYWMVDEGYPRLYKSDFKFRKNV